ncbi:DMT family transporter [Sphingomonas flavalba]|uniref:DMT family transporter n=1 Tax=Sphingomonas flavalba TaxID=2559804 RepID=UPI0039E1F04B
MHPPVNLTPPYKDRPYAKPVRFAFAALLIGNVALAFGPLFVRMATDTGGIGPIAAGFWRLTLAAPMLLLLTRATGQPIGRMSGTLWAMLAISGVLFAGDLASWHLGIMHTTLANSTLFGNSTSLIFPLYGFIVARSWPTRPQGIALLLAAGGAALLLGRSYQLSAANVAGDLLCVLAGVMYAGYLIVLERARSTLRPWPVLALSTVAGILPMLLFATLMGEAILPRDWTAPIMLAIVSQVVGQGLMIYALGNIRPLVIGLALLVQPIVAATIGYFVFGETLGALDIVGAVAIGIALVLVRERRPRPAAG